MWKLLKRNILVYNQNMLEDCRIIQSWLSKNQLSNYQTKPDVFLPLSLLVGLGSVALSATFL
jgi:hypothetical protein